MPVQIDLRRNHIAIRKMALFHRNHGLQIVAGFTSAGL